MRIEDGKIRLPKVGWVKIKAHRQVEGTIKTVTISKTPSGKYFVSILTEYENQVLSIIPKKFVGLDYSMGELFVSSEGSEPIIRNIIDVPKRNFAEPRKNFHVAREKAKIVKDVE